MSYSVPLNKKLYLLVKKDARKKFDKYPSVYASLWIRREYKKRGGKYKETSKKPSRLKGTRRWLDEQWTDVRVYLETGKYLSCGSRKRKTKACRPLKRISAKTPLTVRELLKRHSKRKLLSLAKRKEKDMKGRVNWKAGTFKSSRKRLRGGKRYVAVLCRSKIKTKKWKVVVYDGDVKLKTVRFGAPGYSDFTIHKDVRRRQRYDARHRKRENWSLSGICTAGFWSKWLLWNRPSISGSVRDIKRRFGIRVVTRRASC